MTVDSTSTSDGARSLPRVLIVAGARPNFMKIAPIMAAIRAQGRLEPMLVHTGQHYDPEMNDVFFEELGIPRPDVSLGVGSGSHAQQTGAVMQAIEPVIDKAKPAAVLVVGDVNSTLAAALVAVKKGILVVHVEAGLRSFDRTMPEEINRILTDQISDLLYTTERIATDHLAREGITGDKVVMVGNVMIDSVLSHRSRAVPAERSFAEAGAPAGFGKGPNGYAVLTLHRPSNVDDPATLKGLLGGVAKIAERMDVVFPAHPRTASRIADAGLASLLERPSILRMRPVGYLTMLGLMRDAKVVLTDSGGLQEETTALGVPCLTLRPNTERPITIDQGTNLLIGTDPARLVAEVETILKTGGKAGRMPELWDGRSAERIARHLADHLDAAA